MAYKRDYKKEYANYGGKPKNIKARDQRNKARAMMMKKGLVHKGDGKDVAHLDNNTSHTVPSNLAVQSQHKNRSYARTKGAHRLTPSMKRHTGVKSKTYKQK